MNLYFENYLGQFEIVNKNIKKEDAIDTIKKWLGKWHPQYKCPYFILNKFPDGTVRYDVGSHTEFFWLKNDEVEVE